jgi:heme exporter protein C
VKPIRWQHALGALGLGLLVWGSSMGLMVAPPDRHMGDVSRIISIHVPCAWVGLLVYTIAFVLAIVSLWSGRNRFDAALTASIETGLVLNVLMLVTGMLFARPTWGVWWTWDVRLTTTLLALVLFAGVLALRSFLDEPRRRATWTAVATIIAWVDIPLVYFCVRWWRSMHQVQSSPETIDSGIVWPMRVNAFAVLFLALWFIVLRTRIERLRERADEAPLPARAVPAL